MTETPQQRHDQLRFLFSRQNGKCFICGEKANLDFSGGTADRALSAVRFRLGSRYGTPGRVRRRVMAHRKCADQRSRQIEMSQTVEELQWRSGRFQTETYAMVESTDRDTGQQVREK